MPVPGLRIGGTPPAFARTRRSGWSLPPGRHQACAQHFSRPRSGPAARRWTPTPCRGPSRCSPAPRITSTQRQRMRMAVGPDALSTAGAPYRARRPAGAGRPDPTAAPRHLLGGGAASTCALGGPADGGEKENARPMAHRSPRRDPRHGGGLAYAEHHGPALGNRGGEFRRTVNANPPRLPQRLAHRRPGAVSLRRPGTELGPGRLATRPMPGWPVSPRTGFPYAQPAARLTRVTVRPARWTPSPTAAPLPR